MPGIMTDARQVYQGVRPEGLHVPLAHGAGPSGHGSVCLPPRGRAALFPLGFAV